MKQTTAANTSLILVVLGWSLTYYGFISNAAEGDFSPRVSHAEIEAAQHQAAAMLLIGLVCLVATLWLSGYAFTSAKVRASLAVAAFALPLAYILGFGLPV
jgi:Na+/melibiose symporter-like transporter